MKISIDSKLFPWEIKSGPNRSNLRLDYIDSNQKIKYTLSFRQLTNDIKDQNLRNKHNWWRLIKHQDMTFHIASNEYERARGDWGVERGEFGIYMYETTVFCNIKIPIVAERSTRFFWNLLPFELKIICNQMIIYSVHSS